VVIYGATKVEKFENKVFMQFENMESGGPKPYSSSTNLTYNLNPEVWS
jgi:hypothetical protein